MNGEFQAKSFVKKKPARNPEQDYKKTLSAPRLAPLCDLSWPF